MRYQILLKQHLTDYKRSVLGIDAAGVFKFRGRVIPCEHILPLELSSRNLLPAATESAQAFLNQNPKKRHRYFHHLNSSQAFAFNLFFAYFGGGGQASGALLRALRQDGPLAHWEPEAIPDRREGTNLDVTWMTVDGMRTFCEVKLSESDLGKAAMDDRHERKLRTIYRPVLQRVVDPALLSSPAFFESYQFVRNLWHMVGTKGSRLLFLVPRANAAIWSALEELVPLVAQPYRSRICRVAAEDVLSSLSLDPECPAALRRHAAALATKYVPRQSTGRSTATQNST